MTPDDPETARTTLMTLEAFADTIVPGQRRWPGDRAIAGVSAGGGAVTAGAVDLLRTQAGGLAEMLDSLAMSLNGHALQYTAANSPSVEEAGADPLPPFVALPFADRTELVRTLTAPGHPEKELWVAMAMFSNMAFDTGAHLTTTEAFASGHPGLLTMGFQPPDPDGIWRFPDFSYRRQLAEPHPATTPSGSPA